MQWSPTFTLYSIQAMSTAINILTQILNKITEYTHKKENNQQNLMEKKKLYKIE